MRESKDKDKEMAEALDEATRGAWRAAMIIRLLSDMPGEFRASLLDLARQKTRESHEALAEVAAALDGHV